MFFDDFVTDSVARALEDFARRTGREYSLLRTHHTRKAKTILVAQGSAVETAIVAADALRKHHKLYVGVVGIQSLRPFPTQALREALAAVGGLVNECCRGGECQPASGPPQPLK